MEKYLCKVWNLDRSKKKSFFCQPLIEQIIKKAQEYSLHGNRLVLESDGTDIDDDEVLQYFLKDRSTFMILNNDEVWRPDGISNSLKTYLLEETSASSSIVTISDDEPGLQVISQKSQLCAESNVQNFNRNEVLAIQQEILTPYQDNTSLNTDCENIQTQHVLYICDDFSNNAGENTSTLSHRNTNSRAGCDLFYNFEIPWIKLSPEIIKRFNEKLNLGKLLKAFANVVVDDLRQISHYIPMNVYREVAGKAASKFPDSFIEKDGEGNIMSHSPVSLIATMRNRNNFLNASPKKETGNSSMSFKKRILNAFARSCVNLEPRNAMEVDVDANSKKQFLLSIHHKNKLSASEEETVKKYMNDCFTIQRNFFNNSKQPPTVKDILSNWPMIFRKDCLYCHFSKVMELDVDVFKNNFYTSSDKMKNVFGLEQNAEEKLIIKAICKFFKEKDALIFKEYKFGSTLDEVKNDIHELTPLVTIVKTSIEEKSTAYIWFEKEITTVAKNFSFLDLVLQLLCYYYIFNIVYPKDISQTFEFIMRYFFRFYPSQMRGKKLHINNLRKINSLIRKLDKIV